MEGSLFSLDRQSAGFGETDSSGTGNFVINEPVSGVPFSTLVSAPGVATGSVFVDSTSRFSGGDINALFNLTRSDRWSVNLLGGFRYLELDESINIAANSDLFVTTTYTDNAGNVLATAAPGSTVSVFDQFSTRNQFYGGQVGAQVLYSVDRWSFGGIGKLAIGDTHEVVTVNGGTIVFPVNGTPVALSGGNFATNQIGRNSRDRFALAPELQLNLGYQFTPHIRGFVGYNLIYLSSVARPGNQIDNAFNGVNHPLVPLTSSSFWAQGINLGVQFRY